MPMDETMKLPVRRVNSTVTCDIMSYMCDSLIVAFTGKSCGKFCQNLFDPPKAQRALSYQVIFTEVERLTFRNVIRHSI